MTVTDEHQVRDSGFRCAPWTRDQQVDPVGTAGTYRSLLLVESPQPWPEDVAAIPALARAAGRDPEVRVLAVVPRLDDDSGLVRIVHWQRGDDGAFSGLDHRCPPSEVARLLDTLVGDPGAAPTTVVGTAPPEVLVCTHGKRDACCGRWGTLLHAEVAARWDGVRTWRCSHTGGHRFAPTGFTFPDGRAWAFLDAGVLDGIVSRSAPPASLRPHYRGAATLDPWAQVVERELFVLVGWDWLDHRVTGARTSVTADGRAARVDLHWRDATGAAGHATGRVGVRREVPVLVCGQPPERAEKTSLELVLEDLDPGTSGLARAAGQ